MPPVTPGSFWLEEALSAESAPSQPALVGDRRCDVLIVGGGYTGLWTALELKKRDPACDVVVIERDVCGWGASGRNAGALQPLWNKLIDLVKYFGEEEGLRLAQATADAAAETVQFCADNDIHVKLRPNGTIRVATSDAQIDRWDALLDATEARGIDVYERLSETELRSRLDLPGIRAGIWQRDSATLQPALLVRGLRRVALSRGVTIHEATPMSKLHRDRPVRVTTPTGCVTADSVVLATNAWLAAIPELTRRITPITADHLITEPAPEVIARMNLLGHENVADRGMMIHTFHATQDGRFSFGRGGGGLAYGGKVDHLMGTASKRTPYVVRQFRSMVPALADVPIAQAWTGVVDQSVSGLPTIEGLAGREDIVFVAGYSGNGVGTSLLAAKILASKLLRTDDEWSRCGFTRPAQGSTPPEPLRFVGGQLAIRAVRRKERQEAAGAKPTPGLTTIADFAARSGAVKRIAPSREKS